MKKIVNDLISDLAGAVSENWSDARQIQLAELVQRICRRGSEQARRRYEEMIAEPINIDRELTYEYKREGEN